MLADAHCHLHFEAFSSDLDSVIERAIGQGVERIVVAGTCLEDVPALAALERRPQIDICLGLHPWFLDRHPEDGIERLDQLLTEQPVVALGECGVDAFRENPSRQWELFEAQLQLAKRHALPVVIHCVKYHDEVGKRLKQLDLPQRGLIHAFTGSAQQARRLVDLGYVLGIGGAVTHDRAQKLKSTVAELPSGSFVLETDAPNMTPQGADNTRNEPGNIILIASEVARLRGISVEAVGEETSDTLRRIIPRRS